MTSFKNILEDFYRCINIGGMTAILGKVFFLNLVTKHICSESQNNVFNDYIYIAGIAAMVSSYSALRMMRYFFPKKIDSLLLVNDEIVDAVETMGFILLAKSEGINLNKTASYLLTISSILPLYSLYRHYHDHRYTRGSISNYKSFFRFKRPIFFHSTFEGIYTGMALAAAANAFTSISFQTLYDGFHYVDYQHKQEVFVSLAISCLSLGILSVLHTKSWQLARVLTPIMNQSYYLQSLFIEFPLCYYTQIYSVEYYRKKGWAVAFTIYFGAIALAIPVYLFAKKNPYKESDMPEENKTKALNQKLEKDLESGTNTPILKVNEDIPSTRADTDDITSYNLSHNNATLWHSMKECLVGGSDHQETESYQMRQLRQHLLTQPELTT